MDEQELNELRELVEFLKANGIAEFDLEREEIKLRIKFAGAAPAASGLDMTQLAQLLASKGGGGGNIPSVAASSAAPGAPAASAAPPAAVDPDAGAHVVKSPIVGTFYDAPSPGSEPFVKVGDRVEVGTVLCIVEAMKLMNEIESDAAGEVVRVMPAPGQPVEYGQALYAIRA
ncbi:MAG: acetyl-CoA carboxylase biotin carboxyl carrier protein [Acidobacteriota bacterium]|nr:acetyl-CoA carboxylase biotin carboxyl carrier protein [Acidobacteriota bacterium]